MWLLGQVGEAVGILMVAWAAFWAGWIILLLLGIGIAWVKQ